MKKLLLFLPALIFVAFVNAQQPQSSQKDDAKETMIEIKDLQTQKNSFNGVIYSVADNYYFADSFDQLIKALNINPKADIAGVFVYNKLSSETDALKARIKPEYAEKLLNIMVIQLKPKAQ